MVVPLVGDGFDSGVGGEDERLFFGPSLCLDVGDKVIPCTMGSVEDGGRVRVGLNYEGDSIEPHVVFPCGRLVRSPH